MIHKKVADLIFARHYLLVILSIITLVAVATNASDSACDNKLVDVTVPGVDYFNAFHNCQGCSRHRWVHVKQLNPDDFWNMYNFGHGTKQGTPLYPCRVFLETEIAVGQYNHQEQKCTISYNSKEHKFSSWFQVLTIPGGLEQEQFVNGSGTLYKYELISVKTVPMKDLWAVAVPAGQLVSSNGDGNGFIAFGHVATENCFESVIGVSWQNDKPYGFPRATFSVCGTEVKSYNFDVLVCNTYFYY